jgi:hypothetical protein
VAGTEPSFVGFAAVTDINDIHHTPLIIDREDDSPVAHTNPPTRWRSLQFLDAMGRGNWASDSIFATIRAPTLTGRLSISFTADGLMTTRYSGTSLALASFDPAFDSLERDAFLVCPRICDKLIVDVFPQLAVPFLPLSSVTN